MNYTINGVTKIITPTDAPISGAINVDWQDLYSRWVDWMLTSDNSKYLQAIRIVGGDPLPGSKQLGITYFLLNGWKIRPYEATHVFVLNGNGYSEDGSSPFTPTIGSFNVTIISSVSNLVDSTVQQLPEIEYASFDGRVTIDVDNGVAGTTYPIGTPTNPVNNLPDALSIATIRGFKTLELKSALTITTGQDVSGFTIRSNDFLELTVNSGAILENTAFEQVSLYGVMSGVWNVLIDCWSYNITNFIGWVRGGSIGSVAIGPGDMGAEFGSQLFFDDIVPLFPGVTSTITMNTNVTVAFTNCKDIVAIESMVSGTTISCGLLEGKLTIGASCTGGAITVGGVGTMTNASALTIDDSALVNPDKVATRTWTNATRTLTSGGGGGGGATPEEIWSYPERVITGGGGVGGASINYSAINTHTTNKVNELKEQIARIPKTDLSEIEKQLTEIDSHNSLATEQIIDTIKETETEICSDIVRSKKELKEDNVTTRQLVRQKAKKLEENTQKLADRQDLTDKTIEREADEIESELEKIYKQEADMIEQDLEDQYKMEADEIEKELNS